MAEPMLAIHGLRKAFGALVVTDDVDLHVDGGVLHAVIGPNGAGKTTLLAQIAGEVHPDAGTIALRGRDVTSATVDARARLGIARTFQVPQLVDDFTVEEHAMFAAAARPGLRRGVAFAAFRDARLRETAQTALAGAGFDGSAVRRVASLSHGERKQLEIALALVTAPSLLLLDEPLAGLGRTESRTTIALLQQVKADLGIPIVLVEHDMDAVAQLADVVTVLVGGHVIASGAFDAIRSDPRVRAAYLGDT
ncbi:ABC transporter ATP-binding protein [Vulcanimicrobium alpinum]|uniref:ABC transporter ATP-binding protein n=1 Tax=Vulcanimicrobium alpinum TaxID=3016050 RepID=A0AAN1Y005_UNVUL|nr:ABC transporter ATP-binding protein [Vulcanimicrobium alpinum]BDE08109.1 ABC transporter ATP-binding protein [Vulcanimicrobium alpinum]